MSLRKAYLTIAGESRATAFAALLVQRDIPFGFQSTGKARNDDRLFRFEVESRFGATVFPSPLGDLDQVEDSEPTEEKLIALRDQAKAQYADGSSDDIEVDDEPSFSVSEGGTWVSGWLWVSDEEVEDDDAECGKCVTCGAQCVSGGEGSVICPVCEARAGLIPHDPQDDEPEGDGVDYEEVTA